MSSNTPKGRTILVEVTKKQILNGGSIRSMIASSLRAKGYPYAYVGTDEVGVDLVEIDTKQGNTWYGKIPSAISAKITQSSRAVARPKTMKPFGFSITLFRDVSDLPTTNPKAA